MVRNIISKIRDIRLTRVITLDITYYLSFLSSVKIKNRNNTTLNQLVMFATNSRFLLIMPRNQQNQK